MDQLQWTKAEEIFHRACGLKAAERPEYLDRACACDSDLRSCLDAMLASDDLGAELVDSVIRGGIELAGEQQDELIGSVLGNYRVLNLIGRGGMGSVYLAERADGEYNARVALKVIAGVFTTSAMIARFRLERQILASLNHLHCCALIDGGVCPGGSPYLVMEYVDGVAIDEYARSRKLSIRERLSLFLQLLSAIEYAHQHLVIHRDVKPGNVLVTAGGGVKLLDFGIARLMGTDTSENGLTRPLEVIATPQFASPEQLRGESVSTATDIYSAARLLEHICPDAPAELRSIIRMGSHEDAASRYASAGQFAADIERYLQGFPVMARPDRWTYRAARAVARNKLASAAAAIAVVFLLSGIVAVRREQLRTELRFAEVREIATSFLFEFHSAVQNLPGSTAARKLLVTRALKYLETLSRDVESDLSLRADVADAYSKVAAIQWSSGDGHLGDPSGARASLLKEAAIREQLALPTEDVKVRAALAACYSRLAAVLEAALQDAPSAAEFEAKATALWEALLREAPADFEVVHAAASHLLVSGTSRLRQGKPSEAIGYFERSIDVREAWRSHDPDNATNLRYLAWGWAYSGDATGGGGTEIQLGDRAGAIARTRRGLEILREMERRDPNSATVQRDIAALEGRVAGTLEVMGNWKEAEIARRSPLESALRRMERDPHDADAAHLAFANLSSMGMTLMRLGRYAESHDLLRQSTALNARRKTTWPGELRVDADQASVEHAIGDLCVRQSRYRSALAHYEEGMRLRTPLLIKNPGDARLVWRQARTAQALGETAEKAGDRARATRAYQAAIDLYGSMERSGSLSAADRAALAGVTGRLTALKPSLTVAYPPAPSAQTASPREHASRRRTLETGPTYYPDGRASPASTVPE